MSGTLAAKKLCIPPEVDQMQPEVVGDTAQQLVVDSRPAAQPPEQRQIRVRPCQRDSDVVRPSTQTVGACGVRVADALGERVPERNVAVEHSHVPPLFASP